MSQWPDAKEHPDKELNAALVEARSLATPTRLDMAIGKVWPKMGAHRIQARQELGYRRAMLGYAAVNSTLERRQIFGSLISEEAELPGYDRFQLILECTNLYRNSPLIRAGVDGIAKRVGIIRPHFHTDDKEWNEEALQQWNDWCVQCDIRGLMSFDEFQEQAVKSCFYDGDLGERFCNGPDIGRDASGEVVYDLRIEAVEGDRIAEDYRAGINIDKHSPLGGIVWDVENHRIKAYKVGQRGYGGILEDVRDISAEDFILLFRRQRVDQMRGVPLLAPVVNPAKDFEEYLNSTRVQAKISATFGVVVKRQAAAQFGMSASNPQNQTNYRTQPLSTGKMVFLNPDEDISSFSPDVPGPAFDQFAKFQVRIIAIGMGTTYEMLMHDFTGMSYSSSKTNLMTESLLIKAWHDWQINKHLKRVYNIWVAKRMASRLLDFNPQAYDRVTWQTPAKIGIDPQEDSAADIAMLEAGTQSYTSYFKRLGKEASVELRQIADDKAYIKKLAEERDMQPQEVANVSKPGSMVNKESPVEK